MPNLSETQFTAQKKTLRSSQATSERVQLLRQEYWAQVTSIELKDLVFLDEMGVLLGLMRTHARAAPGERAYDTKLNWSSYRSDKLRNVEVRV
ncbi:hypothetical protein JOY44_21400 [Phormidium sp. CLA17]|uniref:hypothetical protein n=1 Tax=Leptolyngbya sp. Cla-17 TaxID=2803751 RepID=UPI00149303E4|nr:hypothetical protein [Leptolyngbya sp. Cla-17]MBM0744138.1 hypothetical protein [Leptolyngbya sp. Cla-17]